MNNLNAEYTDMVAKFIKEDSNIEFGNLTTAHAANICRQFITAAQHDIEIFSGSMKEIFYSTNGIFDVLEQTAARIKKTGAIRIITINANTEDAQSLKAKFDQINKNNSCDIIEYRPAKFDGNELDLSHFMLVDGKRYRIEKPHERFESMPDEVKASVCCNNPKVVQEKQVFFNYIWDLLKEKINDSNSQQ